MTVSRDLQFRTALREWFAGQSKYKNLREAASGIGIPFDTLRGYFSGKRPNGKNLHLLIELTGVALDPSRKLATSQANFKGRLFANRLLDELQFDLARCIASIPSIQSTLKDSFPAGKVRTSPRAGRQVQSLMDALQRSLEAVVNDPEALELVRKGVSGSDAGYLSGLLGSMFDDRRLQTWRQMTTYRYGSK
jgi:hypothetical protein